MFWRIFWQFSNVIILIPVWFWLFANSTRLSLTRLKYRQLGNLLVELDKLHAKKSLTWEELKMTMADVIRDKPEESMVKIVRNRKAHPGVEDLWN